MQTNRPEGRGMWIVERVIVGAAVVLGVALILALSIGGMMLERWIRCGCWEVPFA